MSQPMNGEKRLLVTDEPVAIENQFRGFYGIYLKSIKKNIL